MTVGSDFTAIRISLASPDQIKSWSYGEVTKPETINYRTLRPEKDGLFCEKIFGPTKDFECFCGKYKKVRYKGLFCDRCGVEVTRSKVRRERMGHIALAAPVAHIWFSKGIPSRLGMLLELSPRNLERVLYFAQYIIISVDEEERADAIRQLKVDLDQTLAINASARDENVQGMYVVLKETLEFSASITTEKYMIPEGATVLVQEQQSLERDQVLAQFSEKIDKLDSDEKSRVVEIPASSTGLGDVGVVIQVEDDSIVVAWVEESSVGYAIEASEAIRQAIRDGINQDEVDTRQYDFELSGLESVAPLQLLPESRHREMRMHYPGVINAGMGAEAILAILGNMDLAVLRVSLESELKATSIQRRKRALKRIKVVDALRRSENSPESMILSVLPVLPPELRPMVQLDGGRFATSDLNDLYRRVINRNNRLRRLLELEAPDIIIRNEKRMLQEAVDALIDNGRRGKAISGSHNHRLKSLSDLLRGKQGRFRQNLLGKRVDYSGRSVIIVGPELKLSQCGLPKKMALELFKPFVMNRLVMKGYAANIKSAKRMAEKVRPEVWDILEEVIKGRPVLLNRAPTLHRLGIQAFEPVLIEGDAIQLHPLVCQAFNADFDGDQMAVHVPLSRGAVAEGNKLMLSTYNMLSPASGEPLVAPTLDMVMGCYYLTYEKPGALGEGKIFGSVDEAMIAYEAGYIHLQASMTVISEEFDGDLQTTPGRLIFNQVLLPEGLEYHNTVMDKQTLKELTSECYRVIGNERTAVVLDQIKYLGFRYATQAGVTIAISDIKVPEDKAALLDQASQAINELDDQFANGLLSEGEQYQHTVDIWRETGEQMQRKVEDNMHRYGGVYTMAVSGAKGSISQISQMAGMRGLMTDPKGRIISLPIKSSFREGLSVLEYFISTHGARKGLADTALRTADSGYLTRRLIDVCQDVIVLAEDCETEVGTMMSASTDAVREVPFIERILGRLAATPVIESATGEIIVGRNEEIDEYAIAKMQLLGVTEANVRTPLNCEAIRGICRMCYGRSMATGRKVMLGEAVGIIAAQSIGEPGTQLTMRTFHTGGVASAADITTGLPRVEELFEARSPKGQALLSEISGKVTVTAQKGSARLVTVTYEEENRLPYNVPDSYRRLVGDGDVVSHGTELALPEKGSEETFSEGLIVAGIDGTVEYTDKGMNIVWTDQETREYDILPSALLLVENGSDVEHGDALTAGPKNPQDILRIQGKESVELYLAEEVQHVYRSQGVSIHEKHIEIIVRQMLRRVQIDDPGDSGMLPGDLIDKYGYDKVNERIDDEGGDAATASPVLLGVTRASLATPSFLAAASFQETTRVLTEASIDGKVDPLLGLKENVIIGRLIPARFDMSEEGRERLALEEGYGTNDDRGEEELRGDDTDYLRTMEAPLGAS
jgi:DNA-directed RNA polymerase subunit beta'